MVRDLIASVEKTPSRVGRHDEPAGQAKVWNDSRFVFADDESKEALVARGDFCRFRRDAGHVSLHRHHETPSVKWPDRFVSSNTNVPKAIALERSRHGFHLFARSLILNAFPGRDAEPEECQDAGRNRCVHEPASRRLAGRDGNVGRRGRHQSIALVQWIAAATISAIPSSIEAMMIARATF